MLFRFNNQYEIYIDNRKYLFRNNHLFHISNEVTDNDDDWSFEQWVGPEVSNIETVTMFRKFMKKFGNHINDMRGVELSFDDEQRKIDRWEEVVMYAVKKHPNGFTFKDLYYDIAIKLGADSEDDARKGIAYHPYSGKKIHVERCFATWITERSPDSRQRYFFGGKLFESKLPLLFVNDELYQANQECKWKPFKLTNGVKKRNYVRGGLWRYDPCAAVNRIPPRTEMLQEASELYSNAGLQGIKAKHGPRRFTMFGIA